MPKNFSGQSKTDSTDTKLFLAEQDGMVDPDPEAAEIKRQKYLLYNRDKYYRNREKILEKRKANYIPAWRKAGRPRYPREYKNVEYKMNY